jgi:S-adenosyl-L-methionine hydrolase (adenosine-forming)
MPIITLTTDFGTRDGYVGAVKGVLARLAPGATVVDIAHDIPRHDVAHAAWVLATACREFPKLARPETTIHIAVVDPGVGGRRRGVVVRADGAFYVGPDNGLFGHLTVERAWAIENAALVAAHASATFHGRDVFAHVAAALARGKHPNTIGSRVTLSGRLPWGKRPAHEGRVVHIDHYGNLVTDLPAAEAGTGLAIAARHLPLVRTYEDVAIGDLLAYIGSAGTVEVAVREGRADRVLDAPRGTRVVPIARGEGYR